MREFLGGMVRRAGRAGLIGVGLLAMLATTDALAGGFTGSCGIKGGGELLNGGGQVPHRGCAWDGEVIENVTMVLNGQGPNCRDSQGSCTLNVDFFDALTGEFLENRNIDVPDAGGGPTACEAQPGDEICGHDYDNISEDCGDGAEGGGGTAVDDSCGCNPDEGDEGCCFQKTGHSVYLKTGIYTRTDRDVTIAGQDTQLQFDRFFNSSRADLGIRADRANLECQQAGGQGLPCRTWRDRYPDFLGYGWRHRYQERIRVLMPRYLDGYGDYLLEPHNRRSLIHYRSDGVGKRYDYNWDTETGGQYASAGSLDRLVRENLVGQPDPLGQNLVVVKPSGERHVFSLPAGYLSFQQPVDLWLARIEAFNSHGAHRGGMSFSYCGQEPGRLCSILLDDGGSSRGLALEYDDQARLERLRAAASA